MTFQEEIWKNFINRIDANPKLSHLKPTLEIMFSHDHDPVKWDEEGNMRPCETCLKMLANQLMKQEG